MAAAPIGHDLKGSTAIVTGASTGNGRGIAIALAAVGVNGGSHEAAHFVQVFQSRC